MSKLGISQRAYARRAGVSSAYVNKLVKHGKLPLLPDGSLDAAACDVARAKHTNVAIGILRKRWQAAKNRPMPKQAQAWLRCEGCAEQYRVAEAGNSTQASPDPQRFCCDLCASDHAAGLSARQIRRKTEKL